MPRGIGWSGLLLLGLLACVARSGAAEPGDRSAAPSPSTLSLAVTAADLDVAECRAFAGETDLGPVPAATLAWLLGLEDAGEPTEWTTGPRSEEVRHFRLVFRAPVRLGTIASRAPHVALLKQDAPAPGDPSREESWLPLEGSGPVRPLPQTTPVRAIRLTYRAINQAWETTRRSTQCDPVLLLSERYWSPDRLGGQARTKVLPPKPDKSKKGEKPAAPSDRWIGYWPESLPVAGVAWLSSAPVGASYAVLDAKSTAHPRLAEESDWQPVAASPPRGRGPGVTRLSGGRLTQAVRVTGLPSEADARKGTASPVCLVLLEEDRRPPTSFLPKSPFAVEYASPLNGFVAVRIADEEGRHVRRLVAEVQRSRGKVAEEWDLADDDGRPVLPGRYRVFGIARPPLKLTHEITVYNPGSPPWNAPVPGGGGWMADHSPPVSCCSVGDRLFFGALGAEFGYGLIATDREGRKVWSDHEGAARLASDGRCAYVVADSQVVRIDPADGFRKTVLHRFQYDEETPGHGSGYVVADHSGTAARPGLLCVSYRSTPGPWIRSAFRGGDLDVGLVSPPVYPKKVHETALTPVEEILSAFLTMPSSLTAKFGEAPTKGPLARTLVLPFRREVPVGSVLVPDGATEVWALRPGKTLPPTFRPEIPKLETADPLAKKPETLVDDLLEPGGARFDPALWVRLATTSKDRPDLALPESGLTTRALVFSGPALKSLDYGFVLDRRYKNAAARAVLRVGEGKATPAGSWTFKRTETRPLSFADPAVATYAWNEPVALRGCAVLRPIPWAGFAIDVWTGAPDSPPDAATPIDDPRWREVHRHRQTRNHIKFNWHTSRVVTADFGDVVATRALRVRYVEPPSGAGAQSRPVVEGGCEAVIAFEPAGGDAVAAADLAERITVLRLPEASGSEAPLLGHLPLPGVGALAFDPAGRLHAACAQGIVRIRDAERFDGAPEFDVVVPARDAGRPRAMAFDAEGRLCVLDGAGQCVRTFAAGTGRETRRIGGPAAPVGPWDPSKMTDPVALAIDSAGKTWVVEQHFQPKRIARWTAEGKCDLELLGPTHYGGGGMLDPRDRTVLNHLGMKFRIDYAARTWRLESRLAPYGGGSYLPDRTTYVGDRRYLVGDRPVVTPFGDAGPTCVVCREIDGVAVPVVASGVLGDWKEFSKNAAIKAAAKDLDATQTAFVWTDADGDRAAGADEVRFVAGREVSRGPWIGDDLSLNFSGVRGVPFRLRPRAFKPDGTPEYDVATPEDLPGLTGEALVDGRGETFVMEHKLLDAAGRTLWTYPDRYRGVQASYRTPWGFTDRPPGVLAGGMGPVGHFEIAGENLFCVGGNNGDYYAFSRDGLLVACLLGGPAGFGRRYFSTADYRPGITDLSDLRKTVEDFHGHVTRAEDGRVYAVAGKNHCTVLRVDGLEGLQRFEARCEVTAADLEKTRIWKQERERTARFLSDAGPAVYTVRGLAKPPAIDGDLVADWPGIEPATIRVVHGPDGKEVASWSARLAFDSQHLYVAGFAVDSSPLANKGADRRTLFQQGDALDLHLGLDPGADPARTDPVPGDVRILFAATGDEPVAVLYRFKVGKGAAEPVVFRSPTGETTIDELRPLTEARIAFRRGQQTWSIEAAIPWKALGVAAPTKPLRLRGDLGATESDPQGTTTVARYYWANRAQVVLSDLPSEARVQPSLWGEFRFEPLDEVEGLLDPVK